MPRITAVYRVTSNARDIEARARAVAVEQSVEMPVAAITDKTVLDDVVGTVEGIEDIGEGAFRVRVGLAVATTGPEPGQLINMLFGNTSIHDDVTLEDAILPPEVAAAFGGPNHGLGGLRARSGAATRAMTCSALKPQGLAPEALAALAHRMAEGGIDFIKDDHGLADQAYSPYPLRVAAVAAAVRAVGGTTRYLPSLSGHLESMRAQVRLARDEGLDGVLATPMIAGLSTFHALTREFPDVAFMVHPAMAGAARIAPPFLLGTLFRLLGADATVFPNHGGRFGYSPETCGDLAGAARRPWPGVKPCVPVPAGGMTLDRVDEILDFYGNDTMLLIGGNLLAAGERLAAETAAFTGRVARHAGT
jgi:ribulose-bisphosphate carboxylase large chain